MESKNSSSELAGLESLSLNIAVSRIQKKKMCTINVSCMKITKKGKRIGRNGGRVGGGKERILLRLSCNE